MTQHFHFPTSTLIDRYNSLVGVSLCLYGAPGIQQHQPAKLLWGKHLGGVRVPVQAVGIP